MISTFVRVTASLYVYLIQEVSLCNCRQEDRTPHHTTGLNSKDEITPELPHISPNSGVTSGPFEAWRYLVHDS